MDKEAGKSHTVIGIAGKVLIALLVLYAAGSLIGLQMKTSALQHKEASLAAEADLKKRTVEQLEQQFEKPVDNDYIISEARSQFGYIMPGERIFEDTQNK